MSNETVWDVQERSRSGLFYIVCGVLLAIAGLTAAIAAGTIVMPAFASALLLGGRLAMGIGSLATIWGGIKMF